MQLLKDLKLKYKIFLVVVILIVLVVDALFLAYTTNRDVKQSFSQLETYAFPVLEQTGLLKDKLHLSLLSLDNYLLTGNNESLQNYQKYLRETYIAELKLFEVSRTQNDFAFTQKFNEHLNAIKDQAEEIARRNADDPQIQEDFQKLQKLRVNFNNFLETEIAQKIRQQIQEARDDLKNTAQRITIYLIIFSILILLLVFFTFSFVRTNISKPITLLTKTAEEFGKGKFKKIELHRDDELGLFAKTFNKMAGDIMAAQKALEIELEKTRELDRQKSEFLSIAAHQLRTPMSGIKWAFKMLFEGDMGPLNAEQKHFLQSGAENSDRMIKLINDLLDVTRIEEQKFQYQFQFLSLNNLIQGTIKHLGQKALHKQVEISLHSSSRLPKVRIDTDKMQIALNNLLDNAIVYSKPGGRVDINLAKTDNKLLVSISDQGYGIPKAEQYRIFTKFYRGSNILKVHPGGSGLGLFLVKDIITKHGGEIWFTSEENKGTTFYFTLPL